ncbi:MAG TPA: sigma-70 family RNA polymerase sigma factor [Alphaproteobacteria bacterium]|nr:sigma-70 family RNA polymerase sigma factor [Alphaproteobacteria bacterium]
MRHQITFKNCEEGRIQQLLDRLIARLDKQLVDFSPEVTFLHGLMEKHPTRALYRVSLVLTLPRCTLVAKEEGPAAESTLRSGFLELERQLAKHKALLRHEHLWKRPARREAVRRERKLGPIPAEERERALLLDLILAHLDKLYNFARRELAYHLAIGDLHPGDLYLEDVVDAVVLEAARKFHQRSAVLNVDRWLLQLALQHIEAEVERLQQERSEEVHVEEDVVAEEGVRGDEVYEYYQPDEALRLADLVPHPYVPTPEQVLESRDLQRYINQTLAKLPRAWRAAFVLYHLEGLTVPEIVEVTGQREPEVRRYLEYARAFLRQKIVESGLAIAP